MPFEAKKILPFVVLGVALVACGGSAPTPTETPTPTPAPPTLTLTLDGNTQFEIYNQDLPEWTFDKEKTALALTTVSLDTNEDPIFNYNCTKPLVVDKVKISVSHQAWLDSIVSCSQNNVFCVGDNDSSYRTVFSVPKDIAEAAKQGSLLDQPLAPKFRRITAAEVILSPKKFAGITGYDLKSKEAVAGINALLRAEVKFGICDALMGNDAWPLLAEGRYDGILGSDFFNNIFHEFMANPTIFFQPPTSK